MKKKIFLFIFLLILFTSFLIICNNTLNNENQYSKNSSNIYINGAGATFPLPLYLKLFKDYYKRTNIIVNFQGVGSGTGLKYFLNKNVEFAGTDIFLSDDELKEYSKKHNQKILHIPMILGAVAISYNLPNIDNLKLSSKNLVDIFLGNITNWTDERLQKTNPNAKLPDLKITVVTRVDSSGTTAIFTKYLSEISNVWKYRQGQGKIINWEIGIGAKRNQGVAGEIKKIKGAIGYIELTYAIENDMKFALIKNSSGNFVHPNINSVKVSANKEIPNDTRIMLVNTSAENGYPISSFSWIVIFQEQKYDGRTKEQSQELLNLILWMINNHHHYAEELHYIPLSNYVKEKAIKILKTSTYNNEVLLKEN